MAAATTGAAAAARRRLLRSVLYMPASNDRALRKSLSLRACDAFVYDLEDAVGPVDKVRARDSMVAFLRDASHREQLRTRAAVVRVNGIDTEWFHDDVRAVAEVRPDAVLLPKAESQEDVGHLRRVLGQAGDTPVWCMVETPRGVLAARELAAAADVLVMGTVDLTNELKCSTDPALHRAPILGALLHTVMCARAATTRDRECAVLDGVYVHLDDDEGFAREAAQGLALGFDGKTIIHPKTVDAANAVFSPSADAVARARRVMDAYAFTKGGTMLLDGRLVEELHVRRAKALLDMHDAIRAREVE